MNIFKGGDIVYKSQDQEEYKTTTIRMRNEDHKTLKMLADSESRSVNFIMNRAILDYIEKYNNEIEFVY